MPAMRSSSGPARRRLAGVRAHLTTGSSVPTDPTSPPEPLSTSETEQIRRYDANGIEAALALGNRGPLRLDPTTGRLAEDIVASYSRYGFYVFTEGVIEQDELALLQREFGELLDRAPAEEGSAVAMDGQPAAGPTTGWWTWADALGDPTGGRGRAAARMRRHVVPDGSPSRVVAGTTSHLQHWAPGRRLYAHPKLLAVAATICGDDFCRFNEGLQIKLPRVGPSVAWHQDGTTHRGDAERFDPNSHGMNTQTLLFGANASNAVWFEPASHTVGTIDIAARVEAARGSDRLPAAVPAVAPPGAVVIFSRNILHASFPNLSDEARVSVGFGYHPRSAVLGARFREGGVGPHDASRPLGWTEEDVKARSAVIPLAIAERAAFYPAETAFRYAPASEFEQSIEAWTAEAREQALAQPMLAT